MKALPVELLSPLVLELLVELPAVAEPVPPVPAPLAVAISTLPLVLALVSTRS